MQWWQRRRQYGTKNVTFDPLQKNIIQNDKRQLSENEEGNHNQSHDYSTTVLNPDVCLIIMTMTRPVLENGITFHLNTLCKNAWLKGLRVLPCSHNNCFRWMFGRCKGKHDDPTQCKVRPENKHPTAAQVTDDCAAKLVELLQNGVIALL